MTSFRIENIPLGGAYVLRRDVHKDARGQFERLFAEEDLATLCNMKDPIRHINRSVTLGQGTVRGLHYQVAPDAETKIVTCLNGTVFDVAVDMRPASPTYLRYHGVELCASQDASFLIPEGFAHGFQVLSARAELLYFHTAAYAPGSERRIHAEDPAIGIDWPLSVSGLSQQDAAARFLSASTETLPREPLSPAAAKDSQPS